MAPSEILHHHTLLHCTVKEEMPALLKNVLDDAIKKKSQSSGTSFLIFCVTK